MAAADVSEIGLGITYDLCGCCLEIKDISVSDNLIVRLTLFYNTHTLTSILMTSFHTSDIRFTQKPTLYKSDVTVQVTESSWTSKFY